MDFKTLAEEIEKATKMAFEEMFEKHQAENIYSFALYSDEGAMTVCPSLNTLSFLNSLREEEDLYYYKFEPAEWKYEAVGAEKAFDTICYTLRTVLEKSNYDEAQFSHFRSQLFETCIQTLKKLKDEDYFKNIIGEDIFLLFTVSDDGFAQEAMTNIVSMLNSNPYKDEYLTWMKTWEE
ncbi:MAG: DUF4303 domain-containing protein [Thermonemataceae bacterium]